MVAQADDTPGFHRDAGAVGAILQGDPGVIAAVDAGAAAILAEIGATKDAHLSAGYVTDRYVRSVKVRADSQARHGTGTRAAQRVATKHATRGRRGKS
jgi:hypothetical protein